MLCRTALGIPGRPDRRIGGDTRQGRSAIRRQTSPSSILLVWLTARAPILGHVTIQRMDNVGIVVDDLDSAVSFFTELGMEMEGRMLVEGDWAGHVVGLDDMRSEIAMMRIPGAQGRLELTKYQAPKAIDSRPESIPANTLGLHRVMFTVDNIEATLERLRPLGAELVGKVTRFEDSFLLCYLRGPSGIILALAEQLT